MRRFNFFLLILLCVGCRAAPTPHPPVTIRVGSADSLQALTVELADAYQQTHSYATIPVRVSNSNTVLRDRTRGMFDLALVSRSPRADELATPRARAVEIARDGIVVVVHSTNPLTDISREQLAKIFSGEILNWSELKLSVPKDADAIQVLSREDGSGTRAVFEQTVMTGRRVTPTALIQSSTRDILAFVAKHPNAVGYAIFNLWQNNSQTRVLTIDNITPSLETIQSGNYSLIQTAYLVIPNAASADVSDFADFVLSPDARALIAKRLAAPR